MIGKANLDEVLPPYLKDWNWKGSVDQFIATWLERDHVVDIRLINAIQQLRKNGFLCCLATSQERNRAEYMKAKMCFQEAFDHLFFSCEAGCQKPDHAYYQYVEKTLHLEKESILFLDDSVKNVTCYNGNDGVAIVNVTGGVAPYTYTWSGTTLTDSVATGLTAGIYEVTVTDASGCVATDTVEITQPDELLALIGFL